MVKYVVVTGGVLSGIGKGVIASSTGIPVLPLSISLSSYVDEGLWISRHVYQDRSLSQY